MQDEQSRRGARRRWTNRLTAVGVGAALAAAGLAAGSADIASGRVADDGTGVQRAGTSTPVVLGPGPATPTFVAPVPLTTSTGQLRASSELQASSTATFVVNYDAGFDANPAAKAAFQAAVDQWSNLVSSSVPIVIDASFTALSSGVLGSAGPGSVYRDFSGAPAAGTWYPVALANARHGSDLDPGGEDISATFSSTYTGFYFGTDGNTGGKIDFMSVIMHEIGHGLGFLGVAKVSGGVGTCCLAGYPLVYDRYTTASGTAVLSYPDSSAALATALQGTNVRFNGAQATTANGGSAPKLYSPNPWQSGSSYSHLDEATYGAGNANSLMTPAIGVNEVIHSPGPVTLGIFADSGWMVGGLPTVSIAGARLVEGNSGTRYLRFTVSLSEPVSWNVSVRYATGNITALAPSDYVARSGTVTIPSGTTNTIVAIAVKGDTATESTERFKVGLSQPTGAVLGSTSVSGYIENDEPSSGIALSVGNASVDEGNVGNRTVSVTVSLSAPSATSVSVNWATGAGSAAAGSDYQPASGTYTFSAGQLYGRVLITVIPDTANESNESIPVKLSNPSGATIFRSSGTALIVDDD